MISPSCARSRPRIGQHSATVVTILPLSFLVMTKSIALVTGGSTAERDVALAGAGQVRDALRRQGFEVTVIDTCTGVLDGEAEQRLLAENVDREPPSAASLADLASREDFAALVQLDAVRQADAIFVVLHGEPGEGGRLQGLFELAGLSFVGSDALGSTLAMDKDIAKRLMCDAGVATAEWVRWPDRGRPDRQRVEALGLPLVVKPSRVGSTVGLSVIDSFDELESAVALARQFDDVVLVEAFVDGRELTVGVLGEQALAVGEIRPQHRIFDYECKYTPGMTEEIFPAPIDDTMRDHLCALALKVHHGLRLRDVSRVDFRIGRNDVPYCLEANTLPGMTTASLLPQSAAAAGIDFDSLCLRMVELVLARA